MYAGPAEGTVTTTGPANFATWFHDTPNVNMGQALTLQFLRDPSKPSRSERLLLRQQHDGLRRGDLPGFFRSTDSCC